MRLWSAVRHILTTDLRTVGRLRPCRLSPKCVFDRFHPCTVSAGCFIAWERGILQGSFVPCAAADFCGL